MSPNATRQRRSTKITAPTDDKHHHNNNNHQNIINIKVNSNTINKYINCITAVVTSKTTFTAHTYTLCTIIRDSQISEKYHIDECDIKMPTSS